MIRLNQVYEHAKIILDVTVIVIQFVFEIIYSLIKKVIRDKPKDISGEIVLITGTAHGIGKELALQYTAQGCEVICVDINEENNDKVVEEANSLRMGTAYGYKCDVRNREELKKLSDQIISDVGHVSVVVNNAGVMPSHPLLRHTENEIRQVFEVNVFANFWILESFLPHLLSKGRGHVIAISSMAGLCGLNNLVPYCATKFAVRGLMEGLTEEIRLTQNSSVCADSLRVEEAAIPTDVHKPNKKEVQDIQGSSIKTTVIYPFVVDTGLCKQPKTRFPSLLGIVPAKSAAAAIIDAHRRNLKEISIPSYLLALHNIFRCLPINCGYLFRDFVDAGVESDL
ncbi:Short-chain dehydrogenase/reductase family 16C member 6 [Pseudolycoriella hygida]|uniref:Short-chain dehydrogenase/reductase 3 n=1 Tax=Pseudolycoriella hygida TaxID=35572 RepID=A0A9Q0NED7_9DIPT|nr:Short-chain dehydrogenase/reductase family 16C member 6 [Pseudolycoriella hygida]